MFDHFSGDGMLAGSGKHTITGFQHGSDHIRITGGIGFADLQISQVDANTVIVHPTTAATSTLNGISMVIIDATDCCF